MASRIILDSEALSALAFANLRAVNKARAQVIMELAAETRRVPIVPAPVLTEVCRGDARDAAVNRVLRSVEVVAASEAIARAAGSLLFARGLSSEHAVDALVVATAAVAGGGLIVTGDPDDLLSLASKHREIFVFAL